MNKKYSKRTPNKSKARKSVKSRKEFKSKKNASLKKRPLSKCKKVNFNIVLDLDNTIISSLIKDEYKKIDDKLKKNFTSICGGLYYTMPRPHLDKFLEYIFPRFHVSVWTAATKDYAKEIIDKFVLKNKKYKLREFLYDVHCKESMQYINPNTMKDLNYLYVSKKRNFNKNNTVIVDDLKEVLKNNKQNSIDSEYFDSSKKNASSDTFLLNIINDLKIVHDTLCKQN